MNESVENTIGRTQEIETCNRTQINQMTLLREIFQEMMGVLESNSRKADITTMVASELSLGAEKLQSILGNFTTEPEKPTPRDRTEKRQHPRINNSIKVSFEANGEVIEGVTRDISMTGCNLRCKKDMQLKQRLSIEFMIPLADNVKQPMKVEAQMLRKKREDTDFFYGIEFIGLDTEKEQLVKNIFDYYLKPHSYA